MADSYDVKLVSKRERTICLELCVRRFDSLAFPSDPSFGLTILWESTLSRGGALAAHVTLDNVLDRAWMSENARRFVQSFVADEEFSHLPVPGMVESYGHRGWRDPANWPRNRVALTVTDDASIAHLEESAAWPSRA